MTMDVVMDKVVTSHASWLL